MLVTNHGSGKELFLVDGERFFIVAGDNLIDDKIFNNIKGQAHYKDRVKTEDNPTGIFSTGGRATKGEKKAAQITAEFEAEKKKILEGVEEAKAKVEEDHKKKVDELEDKLLKATEKIAKLEANLKKKIEKVNPKSEA